MGLTNGLPKHLGEGGPPPGLEAMACAAALQGSSRLTSQPWMPHCPPLDVHTQVEWYSQCKLSLQRSRLSRTR